MSFLRSERLGAQLRIEVASVAAPLGKRGFAAVDELRQLLESLHRGQEPGLKTLLFIQKEPTDDFSLEWYDEIHDQLLLFELAHRIETWRWVLSLLRHSPVPVVYVAGGDATGMAWELALACHLRLWLSTDARVGFPEITCGAFPSGGVLESLAKRLPKVRERWENTNTIPLRQAAAEGLIEIALAVRDFSAEVEQLIEMALLGLQHKDRPAPDKRRRQRYDFARDHKARRDALDQISAAWRSEAEHLDPKLGAWEYCWRIAKEGRIKDAHERGRLIAFIAAQHLLTPRYATWLLSEIKAKLVKLRPQSRPADSLPVLCDLNFKDPAPLALTRLWEDGTPTVFVAHDARALAASLNNIFSSLNQHVSEVEAEQQWHAFVHWYVGKVYTSSGLGLRFGPGERLEARAGPARLEFNRLQSDSGRHGVGLLELIATHGGTAADPDVQKALQLAQRIADAVLMVGQVGEYAVPPSLLFRSRFIEEIAAILSSYDNETSVVLEALKGEDWSFASDEDAWDDFLRFRTDNYPYDPELLGGPLAGFRREVWEARSLRELKHAIRRYPQRTHAMPRDAAAISRHFAIFAGLLVWHLGKSPALPSYQLADYLSVRALGFPRRYGTPLTFLRSWGLRRCEHYALRIWPGIFPQEIWSGLSAGHRAAEL